MLKFKENHKEESFKNMLCYNESNEDKSRGRRSRTAEKLEREDQTIKERKKGGSELNQMGLRRAMPTFDIKSN